MENFIKGTLVEFKSPNENEIGQKFIVLEDRETRVLVQDYNDSSYLAATFCYLKSDLQIIK